MSQRVSILARFLGRFMWVLVARVVRHDIASLAAIIAFYALFSLFPLLLLIIFAITKMLPHIQIQQMLLVLLQPYFPEVLQTREFISSNLTMLSEQGSNIGLVSALTLVWSATSGFIGLQQALDVIWEANQRSFLVRRLIAVLMLVVLLFLTIGSGILSGIYPLLRGPRNAVGWHHTLLVLHSLAGGLFPLSLLLACLIVYRYLSSRETPWVYLWPGAMVTMVLVDVGRQVFTWYASNLLSNHYQVIYGTVATVMLVVLWMYLASIAMLFGAEVSATLQELLHPGRDRT